MKKLPPTQESEGSDRRSGDDRRRVDGSPPSKSERRRTLEPRKPDVVERDMTNSEWASLNKDDSTPTN